MENVIKIGKKEIGDIRPVYIIAEVGLNHQGDLKLAKQLINHAVQAGADAVKFQKRSLKKLYKADVLDDAAKEEHATHYLLEHIKKSELADDAVAELCDYTRRQGADFLCTPWDEESLKFLSSLNLPAYKIASADMFNFKLIRAAAALKKPLIVSCGMSFMSEIEQLADYLRKLNAEFVLLHCNSTYPAPFQDINLRFMTTMREKFGCLVGYSGHEQGISVGIAAAALGAAVIEKHITLDRGLPGPDHKASLLPEEFKRLVTEIRTVEEALGESIRYPTRGEYLNREALSKSLVAARPLEIGRTLSYDDIDIKSPGKGTSPLKLDMFVGRKLVKRNIPQDDYLLESDVDLIEAEERKKIKLNRPWGIVARMSDIDGLIAACQPDFVEIHLTDTDINADRDYGKTYDLPLVVHGPEYDGDLLLDISSLDEERRTKSVAYFNKAMDHARKLKELFSNRREKARFVVHPGGMNMRSPLLAEKPQLYKNLSDSLKRLNAEGLELLLENMPGCPWYFGGQWFHASFMDAEEIAEFAKTYGYGVTFDTSHAALYCNYYQKNLEEFTKTILPVTRYIHISDAAKFNGEGLQIGDGNINFQAILPHIAKTDLPILPEIWQGHKFGGLGFAQAVRKLKEINPDL